MKKSLPQSNALHLTAPPLRGGGNGGGKILRIRAPFCLLRRHFPYQGNHPALPHKFIPTNPNFRMGLLCPSLPTVKCGHLQNGEKCISVCVVFAIQTDFLCFCVRFRPLQPKVSADFRRCKAECMAQPTWILVCSCCRKEKSTHAF